MTTTTQRRPQLNVVLDYDQKRFLSALPYGGQQRLFENLTNFFMRISKIPEGKRLVTMLSSGTRPEEVLDELREVTEALSEAKSAEPVAKDQKPAKRSARGEEKK